MPHYFLRYIRCTSLCLALALSVASCAGMAGDGPGQGYPLRGAPAIVVPVATAPAPSPAPAVKAQQPAAATAVVVGPATPDAGFETHPFTFRDNGARRRDRASQGENSGSAFPSLWPALFCVVTVCGLFVGILCLAKKYLPGHRQLFSHPSMEILGRTHLDQRRYVSLLRVGKRIIVVGVSPDDIHSLSEITDEAEVTGLMEVARPKTEAGLTIFQRLFQRNVIETDAAETRTMAVEKARELEEQMTSIRRRVQSLRDTDEKKPAAAGHRIDAVG